MSRGSVDSSVSCTVPTTASGHRGAAQVLQQYAALLEKDLGRKPRLLVEEIAAWPPAAYQGDAGLILTAVVPRDGDLVEPEDGKRDEANGGDVFRKGNDPEDAEWRARDGSRCAAADDAAMQTVGVVVFRRRTSEIAEMKRLFVVPEQRGKGIGRALVRELVERARLAGYHKVVLDTVDIMPAALHIYRALGFTQIEAYYDSPLFKLAKDKDKVMFFEKTLV